MSGSRLAATSGGEAEEAGAAGAWSVWQRDRAASFMREWSYVLAVSAFVCVVMAVGLWLR